MVRVVSAPVRFPRFFVTSPMPCPYLPGRTERKVFTELKGENADDLNDALSRIGFRRSQTVAYRPSCVGCTACVSVRVVAGEFTPSSSQRKTLRQNDDLSSR
jgi:arginine-tRNA-protein transferase